VHCCEPCSLLASIFVYVGLKVLNSGFGRFTFEDLDRPKFMNKEHLQILRNSALYGAAGAVGCIIGSGAPVLITFFLFFTMFLVAHLLGFPWMKKNMVGKPDGRQ